MTTPRTLASLTRCLEIARGWNSKRLVGTRTRTNTRVRRPIQEHPPTSVPEPPPSEPPPSTWPLIYPDQPVYEPSTASADLESSKKDSFPFKIIGHETHIIEIDLAPEQTVRAEPGSLVYLTHGVEMTTHAAGGIVAGITRLLADGTIFLTDFTFKGNSGFGRLVLGADYPAKLHPLRLDELGPMICQKGAFLVGSPEIEVTLEFTKRFGIGFFGGEGFILQRVSGSGTAVVKVGGALIKRVLRPGEQLKMSSGSLVAFQPSVSFDIQRVGGLKNIFFGGEGLFLATLTGPGTVLLQGLPFDRLVSALASKLPSRGGFGGSSSRSGSSSSKDEAEETSADTSSESESFGDNDPRNY